MRIAASTPAKLRLWFPAALILAVLPIVPDGARAGNPGDDCIQAASIGEGSRSGSTVGATNDGAAPCGASATSPDVWFQLAAPRECSLVIDTCGSSFDTVLSLHTGCPGTESNTIACNDDACGLQSQLTVPARAGELFLIRVSGFRGATGEFILNVACPPNGNPGDDCIQAAPIGEGSHSGSTLEATNDGSAPCGASESSPDVWFQLVAPRDCSLVIDTCGSGFDTVLSVHTGCPGNESNVLACNDDACGLQSQITVPARAGELFLIRVSGFQGAAGEFVLNVRCQDEGGEGVNPNGFVQTRAWNLLLPLTQLEGCDGGGEDGLLENWVAPHDLGLEDPKAGDIWDDIDFNDWTRGPTAGFNLGGLAAGLAGRTEDVPLWLSLGFLETRLALPPRTLPSGDEVDFRGLLEQLASFAPSPDTIALENTLAVATTYVANRTGTVLPVNLCTSSDDAIQVWVNDTLVQNASVCRPTEIGCSELAPFCLPPGVSRITVLVWQGSGLWSFHLAMLRLDGRPYTDADAAEVEFLGSGEGNPLISGQTTPTPAIERRVAPPVRGPGGEVTVELHARGLSTPLTVTDRFPAGWLVVAATPGAVVGEDSITWVNVIDAMLFYAVAPPDGRCESAVFSGVAAVEDPCPVRRTPRDIAIQGDTVSACVAGAVAGLFLRGESNGDGQVDLSDAVNILNVLFVGIGSIACWDGADADDNGQIELTDAIRILAYLFLGGLPPARPGPTVCGQDPTPDDLPVCGSFPFLCNGPPRCDAPGARKTLVYSRGNNDCNELTAQKAAAGTFVYTTGTFDIDVTVRPSTCYCDEDGDCQGAMEVVVVLKYSGACANTSDLSGMDLVKDAAPSTPTKQVAGNPPPNIETVLDRPAAAGAPERRVGGAAGSGSEFENLGRMPTPADPNPPRIWQATARNTVPCREGGPFPLRFRIADTGGLQAYVDVNVTNTKTAVCTLATALEAYFLEYLPNYDFEHKGVPLPNGMNSGLCVKPTARGMSATMTPCIHPTTGMPSCPGGYTLCGPLAGAAAELPGIKHTTVTTKADGSKESKTGETRNISKLVSFDCHDGRGVQGPREHYPAQR